VRPVYGETVLLPELPRIERLTLARVTKVPDWHPEHASFEPFPVYGWVIRHPDGVILVDTGIGEDEDAINDWYHPHVVSIEDALASVQLAPSDITAVVLSHLHFDHCGQQRLLAAPVFVQRAEHHEAQRPRYTIARWAEITQPRLRLVDGDDEIADGVKLVATPGHTPGHQAVVIEARGGRVVLGAQCAFRAHEVSTGEPADTNLHDESWRAAARESLARVRRLGPATVQLSHDPTVVHLS
jgi:N-acyl homoserine lactone hydrolase